MKGTLFDFCIQMNSKQKKRHTVQKEALGYKAPFHFSKEL